MNVLNEVNYKILSVVGESIADDPAKMDMLARVKKHGDALRYAPAELKGDREIVLAAVRQDGWFLQYASAELQGDREIVLVAVSQTGHSLAYASDALKADAARIRVPTFPPGDCCGVTRKDSAPSMTPAMVELE